MRVYKNRKILQTRKESRNMHIRIQKYENMRIRTWRFRVLVESHNEKAIKKLRFMKKIRREFTKKRIWGVNMRGLSFVLSFSLTPALSGKKENEQLSGGHFVFPARCAVLICPVNPGQVLERSVPAPGAQLARWASDAMSRRGPSAPGVASTTSPEATTGRRIEWQVVRYDLSQRASMCACVHVCVRARAGASAVSYVLYTCACIWICVWTRVCTYSCVDAMYISFLLSVYITRN